ncbi:TPA: hypothetical protein PGG10_000652 [Acinetobacter nosocomialis]|nr:hypothetical protein [Acinetobacter nosocomialis]
MSGSNNNTNCSKKDCSCGNKEILQLLTQIVEQNTTLIQQLAQKDQVILAALEQNNELLMQLSEQESVVAYGNKTLD